MALSLLKKKDVFALLSWKKGGGAQHKTRSSWVQIEKVLRKAVLLKKLRGPKESKISWKSPGWAKVQAREKKTSQLLQTLLDEGSRVAIGKKIMIPEDSRVWPQPNAPGYLDSKLPGD